MIKAVLFDYGGVLSPGGKNITRIFAQLLGVSEEQVKFADIHQDFRRGDISAEEFFIRLSAQNGKTVTAEDFVKLSDIFVKNQAVYQLAEQLRQHQITTGILSNVYQMSADILRKDGYYQGFDPIITSCETGLAKPDPAFYKLAIERVGCAPQEILFIDDQDKCLPPAQALGMHVIKAESEEQIVKDTKKLLVQENGLAL